MSKYGIKPFDLHNVQNCSLKDRSSKVGIQDFGRPIGKGASVSEFLQSLPAILGAQKIRELAAAIINAKKKEKSILWGMGGHVIKTGLSPILIDLMDKGFVSCLAMNGSCIIHDFEIATIGSTSENVEVQLQTGAFGMAEETGYEINQAIREGAADGLGIGESLGRRLEKLNPAFGPYSLLLQAYSRNIPVTVHVTIGADIIHNHPNVSPSDIGEGSHRDFRLFASMVSNMNDGGVYLNC
jgi:deoxyhypusine synthase